jgi:hypothetical protein
MARWKAEYFDRSRGFGGSAAMVGTSCHYALEKFVEWVYLTKEGKWSDVKQLELFYMRGFMETFGHGDFQCDEYKDGWELVLKWWKRTDLSDAAEIISVENKQNFPVPVIMPGTGEKFDIPCTYIMDRMDVLVYDANGDEEVVRVVDYKTIRIPLDSDELKQKVQAKVYALMAKIKYPKARRIWVVFDLLRHESVGVAFDHADCVEIWEWLKREAQRIVDTPENNPPESLNDECRFCVRKATCKTLLANVQHGGIFSLDPLAIAQLKLELEQRIKGLQGLVSECEGQLLAEASARDELEWNAGPVDVEITASRRRNVTDPELLNKILGPDLVAQYGKIGVTEIDSLLKTPGLLTDDQKAEIKELVKWKYGDLKAKVKVSKNV